MRDVFNELLAKQAAGDAADYGPLRDRLNRTYDAFHRRFGPINKTVNHAGSVVTFKGTTYRSAAWITRRFTDLRH